MTSNDNVIEYSDLYMIPKSLSWDEQIRTAKVYIIYRITNLLENKVYIGKSKNGFHGRYKLGKWYKYSHNDLLKNDYKRLGPTHFFVDIFEQGLTDEEARECESFSIMSHNSLYPNGYNKTNYSCKKQKDPEKIVQIDPKTKKTIKIHNSTADASNEINIPQQCIARACNSDHLKAAGFVWRFLNKKSLEFNYNSVQHFKPVLQIDLNTHMVIAEYKSIKEASRKTGIKSCNIGFACNNKIETAGNYKWKFE